MEQLVITRTNTTDTDYAFANARDPSHLEVAAKVLEADGYTVNIVPRKLDDGSRIYALTATRSHCEVRQ